jgi:hypothetical protein
MFATFEAYRTLVTERNRIWPDLHAAKSKHSNPEEWRAIRT